jgi:hypothetical protein
VRVGRHRLGDVTIAAAVAATFSGVPSTAHAVLTGRSPLAAARAAGELLGRPGLGRGLVAHLVVSGWWTLLVGIALPRRHPRAWGAVFGVAIAALDLGIARRRFPAIAGLHPGAQVADHVAFGVLVADALSRADARRDRRVTSAPTDADGPSTLQTVPFRRS